jgi:hypothetical protein
LSGSAFFSGSQLYTPLAVLKRGDEVLAIAGVGMKSAQRYMILTPAAEPAWAHEPLGSLSDVAWSLRAHQWHLVAPEPVGANVRTARRLARLLAERA